MPCSHRTIKAPTISHRELKHRSAVLGIVLQRRVKVLGSGKGAESLREPYRVLERLYGIRKEPLLWDLIRF